jgi:outer membrane receptor protein involved in Fe transport
VAHASVSYELVTGLSLQATINNLFNTSYAHPGIQTADNVRFASRVPQPGRSAFVRLVSRF